MCQNDGAQGELEMPEFFLEMSILQRLMYKNKLQHKNAGHFKHLVEVWHAVLCPQSILRRYYTWCV